MEWIDVKDRLPEPEIEVLVCTRSMTGYRKITSAIYEDGTITDDESDWYWEGYDLQYDEEQAVRLVRQGWFATQHYRLYGVSKGRINDAVTHWMSMPEMPEES